MDERNLLMGVGDPFQVFWPTYMSGRRHRVLGNIQDCIASSRFFLFFSSA